MIDILDELEDERRCIKLTLISGETLLGYTKNIVWLEDDEGWDTIKAIWFRPKTKDYYIAFTLEEIASYEVLD